MLLNRWLEILLDHPHKEEKQSVLVVLQDILHPFDKGYALGDQGFFRRKKGSNADTSVTLHLIDLIIHTLYELLITPKML